MLLLFVCLVVVIGQDHENANQVIVIDTVPPVMNQEMAMRGGGITITKDGFPSPQAMNLK